MPINQFTMYRYGRNGGDRGDVCRCEEAVSTEHLPLTDEDAPAEARALLLYRSSPGDCLLRMLWRSWEGTRSTPVLRCYEGMQISFVEAPAPAHLVSYEPPGREPAADRWPAYPEELGRLLEGEKSILFVEMLWCQIDLLWGSLPCSISIAPTRTGVGRARRRPHYDLKT